MSIVSISSSVWVLFAWLQLIMSSIFTMYPSPSASYGRDLWVSVVRACGWQVEVRREMSQQASQGWLKLGHIGPKWDKSGTF